MIRVWSALVLLAFMCVGTVVAQSSEQPAAATMARPWMLDVVSVDEAKLKETLSTRLMQGFSPAGIEVDAEGTVYLLSLKNSAFDAKKYALSVVEFSKVNDEVLSALKGGYFPIDIAVSSSRVFLLFIQGKDYGLQGWRMQGLPTVDPAEVRKDNAAYGKLGFIPMGISIADGTSYILYLKFAAAPFEGIGLKRYKNDGTQFLLGLDYEATQKRSPLGFSFTGSEVWCYFYQ